MQLKPNPYFKNNKKSFRLALSCGHCKTFFAHYQKVGKGNLIRIHLDRIIESTIDLSKQYQLLICPECNAQLATLVLDKKTGRSAYVAQVGSVNKKKS